MTSEPAPSRLRPAAPRSCAFCFLSLSLFRHQRCPKDLSINCFFLRSTFAVYLSCTAQPAADAGRLACNFVLKAHQKPSIINSSRKRLPLSLRHALFAQSDGRCARRMGSTFLFLQCVVQPDRCFLERFVAAGRGGPQQSGGCLAGGGGGNAWRRQAESRPAAGGERTNEEEGAVATIENNEEPQPPLAAAAACTIRQQGRGSGAAARACGRRRCVSAL